MELKLLHQSTARMLAEAGIDEPRREAAAILVHHLDLSLAALYSRPEMTVSSEKTAVILETAKRRAAHEPLAYLLGRASFSGLDFLVGPGVLVPRPDSEILVETGLSVCRKFAPERDPLSILDVCTGSGCLGISLHHQLQQLGREVRLWLTDNDPAALAYTRKNLDLHNLAGRAQLEQADLFPAGQNLKWDLILANPPYIASRVIAGLMPEVRCHEPLQALDGGPDGLDYYRRLVDLAPDRLNAGGWLLVEHGFDQASAVSSLFTDSGRFRLLPAVRDYGGQLRVSGGQLKGEE